jgi:DNA-binding SARP family transcriptional activator
VAVIARAPTQPRRRPDGGRARRGLATGFTDLQQSTGDPVDERPRHGWREGTYDPPPVGGVRIQLFGPLAVHTASRALARSDFPSRKAKSACEILASAGGRAVSKDELIEALWGDKLPQNPDASAHHTISLLRRTLVADDGSQPIVTDRGRYRMDLTVAEIDIVRFDELVHRATSEAGSSALPHLLHAVDLVGGTVLEDEMYAPWATGLRDRYLRRVQRVLLDAARMALVGEQPGVALQLAERARLESDVVVEEAFALCASALIRLGRRHEARVLIAELERRLLDEFGADISPETGILRALLRAQPSSPTSSPVITVETTVASPIEVLPFVGRVDELAFIAGACHRLGEGSNQLVIVRGGPGIGKSRLLAEVGANLPACATLRRFACLPSDVGHRLFAVNRLIRSMVNEVGRARVPAPSESVTEAYARLADLIDELGPTVLAIDDLQWSDAESQAVLTAVARPHAVRSVLVLATVRTDTGVEAGRHLELCPPGASTIELGSLPRSAVDALPMTRAWEETGGHPWLLAACVEADRLDGHLGAAVIAGVLEWVGSPGSAVRLVLGSAASIGSRFRVDELSAVVGVSPATTLEILEDPERRQLVARVGSAERPREQEFAFCADLARRVLSASVARSQVPA